MRLFVGNLSFQTSEDNLRDAFGAFGSVTDLKIMTDRETGRSRGFAFITFSSKEEGEAAIRGLDGKSVDGRPLRVNEATPREEGGRNDRNDRGGRGGGGGGRDFAGSRRY